MKTILTGVFLLTAAWAQATLTLSQSFSGGAIPDGNPVGMVFSGTFSLANPGEQVGGLTVGLNISGGYNGDLYAYLVAPNGTLVMLMNQPGTDVFGAGGAGMNLTLTDATGPGINGSIQNAGNGFLTGSYNASGSLSAFNGSPVNGTWNLFFADMASGGGTATLNSWTLTVVPEPANAAMAIFGVILTGAALARWCLRPVKQNSILSH